MASSSTTTRSLAAALLLAAAASALAQTPPPSQCPAGVDQLVKGTLPTLDANKVLQSLTSMGAVGAINCICEVAPNLGPGDTLTGGALAAVIAVTGPLGLTPPSSLMCPIAGN